MYNRFYYCITDFFSVKVQISVCVCVFGSSHVNARQQTVPTDWTSRLTWCTGLMLLLGERLFADQRFETNPSQQTREQNMFSFDDRHGHAKVKPIVFARATKCCQNALVLIRTNLRTLLCFWLKNKHSDGNFKTLHHESNTKSRHKCRLVKYLEMHHCTMYTSWHFQKMWRASITNTLHSFTRCYTVHIDNCVFYSSCEIKKLTSAI